MGKKRIRKKKYSAKKNRSTGILPILFIVALLALFSETVRTIPVGAFSDNFSNITYEVPRLNSALLEDKLIQNNNKIKYKATKEEIIIKTKFPNEDEAIKKEEEIIIAKIINSDFSFNEKKVEIKEVEKKDIIVDTPKIEETIKLAAETKTKSITINGEETLIPGSSDKNITYMQILQNPNDLDLNLKYAKQQSDVGNFKQTIATLERLNMLYPENIEIKWV